LALMPGMEHNGHVTKQTVANDCNVLMPLIWHNNVYFKRVDYPFVSFQAHTLLIAIWTLLPDGGTMYICFPSSLKVGIAMISKRAVVQIIYLYGAITEEAGSMSEIFICYCHHNNHNKRSSTVINYVIFCKPEDRGYDSVSGHWIF
jgi:hypothetical protein